jgi:hypothetical protein
MAFDPLALLRGYRKVRDFGELGAGRVELEGRAELVCQLIDPLSGDACIALEYHAAPPSSLSVQGPGISSRAFTVSASQAVDFVLSDGAARVLIRVAERQDDVANVHQHLMDEYGLELRTEVLTIRAGDTVCVRGKADPTGLPVGSPYRTPTLAGVVLADRFWVVRD